jgi:hypothetical protein
VVDESGDLEAEERADDNWSIVEAVGELDKRLSASPPKIAESETEEHRQNESGSSPKMDVSNESSNDESEVTVVAKNDAPKNDAPKNDAPKNDAPKNDAPKNTTENVVAENDVDENVTKNDMAQNLAQFFESGKSFSCAGFTLTPVSNKPSTSKDVNHPVFFQAF